MGIKTTNSLTKSLVCSTLKNLPTTWGLRLLEVADVEFANISEKPPHHMGIKTIQPTSG